jgi:hypothetical protein
MSTRLSSLLVQASVVSVKQIERALERQVLRGGQLDTNLLEVGVGESAILPHLAKSRDLEPAARSVWPTPPQQILSMLSATTAQQSKLAPLGKEGGRFYVLTHESFSAAVLADVSAKLGLAVVPVIIPEFRVHEALSRYYGFPMPPRSAALVAKYPQLAPTEEEAHADYPWATRNSTAWQRITSSAIVAVSSPLTNGGAEPILALNNIPIAVDSDQIQILLPPEPLPPTEDPTPSEPVQTSEAPVEDQPTPVEAQIPLEAAVPETNYQPTEAPENSPPDSASVVHADPEIRNGVTSEASVGQVLAEPNMHFDTPAEGTIPAAAPEEHQDQRTPTENHSLLAIADHEAAQAVIQEQAAPPEEVPVEVPAAPSVIDPATEDPSKATIHEPISAAPTHLSLDELKVVMEGDLSRDEILRQALAFLGQFAPEAFLFQVQPENNLLMSREGVRRDHPVTSIPGIPLPLAKTPILQRVVSTKNFLLGFPSEDYGLLEFFGLFDRKPPGSVFALPIVIKSRVVAVFLGVSDDIFTAQDVAEVPALGVVTSNALLSLIQRKKKGESPSGEGPKPRIPAPFDSDDMNTIPEIAAVKKPAPFASDEVLTQLRLKATNPPEEVETQPKLKIARQEDHSHPSKAANPEEVQASEPKASEEVPVQTQQIEPVAPLEEAAVQTQQTPPITEAPIEEPAIQTSQITEENPVFQTQKAEPIAEAPIEEPVVQPAEPVVEPTQDLSQLPLRPAAEEVQKTEPISDLQRRIDAQSITNHTPQEAENQLSQTIAEDEVVLDPADIQEEPSPPQVYQAQNLAARLAQAPVQDEFFSRETTRETTPRSPLIITHDLLRQTERLEKEHEALDLLAALIQTPKPKKAPDPSIEISRLLEVIDLGTHPNGNPVEHNELLTMVEQLVAYGDTALPAVFALFPGRRLPKTPGVLRLEEGNLLRLLLRFGARSIPGLKRLVSHPEQITRFYAVWCLASLKEPDTISAMLPGMFDADPMVRQVSLAGASQFARHPNFAIVLSAVRQALSSSDERHRMFASSLVARFRMVELWPIVLDRLDDPSPEVAKESLNALMTLTFQDLGPKKKTWVSWFEKNSHLPREAWLVEALSHKELNIRQGAIQELRMITGNTFDYRPDADKSERKTSIKQWEAWLHKGNG